MSEHNNRTDAFVTSITGGAELNFLVKLLSGRARQLIRLHRISQNISFQPFNIATDFTMEVTSVFQAGQELPGSSTIAPQARVATMFEGFTAGGASYRNRSQIIDHWRIAYAEELDDATGKHIKPTMWRFSESYNLLVPAVHVFMGLFANLSMNAVEVFTRVEYEWETHDLATIAAVQFAYGQDPLDFDRENL